MSKVRLTSLTAEPRTVADVREFDISPLSKGRVILKQIEAAIQCAGTDGKVEIEIVQ